MKNYTYQKSLKIIWKGAVSRYIEGCRDVECYFDATTLTELASIGLSAMDVYDYAEDFVIQGEPDFETFLMVSEVRRDYFLTEQDGAPSANTIDSKTLPPKTCLLYTSDAADE